MYPLSTKTAYLKKAHEYKDKTVETFPSSISPHHPHPLQLLPFDGSLSAGRAIVLQGDMDGKKPTITTSAVCVIAEYGKKVRDGSFGVEKCLT